MSDEPRTFRKIVRSDKGGVLYAVMRRTNRTYVVTRWDATTDVFGPVVVFSSSTELAAEPGGYPFMAELIPVKLVDEPRRHAIDYARTRARLETY